MKLTTLSAALAVALTLAPAAHARELHHRHGVNDGAKHRVFARHHSPRGERDPAVQALAYAWQAVYHGGYGRRPAAWCGWQMRQLVDSDPGPQFNLARNWARWGHAGPAGIGAVVVWPHHVGKIVGQESGLWVIQSGNDGHRLRSRARSIAGAIAIRWG